jgi:potassium-dependent mechanosensitive channel
MTVRNTTGALILLLFVSFTAGTHAQSLLSLPRGQESQEDTARKESIRPLPLNTINNATTEAFQLFSRAESEQMKSFERNRMKKMADSLSVRVGLLLSDTLLSAGDKINIRELDRLENSLLLQRNRIVDLQDEIDMQLNRTEQLNQMLHKSRQRWSMTLQMSDSDELPLALERRINHVISSNDSISSVLQEDIDFMLTLSDQLTTLQIRLDQVRNDLSPDGMISSSIVFRRDMPPLWALIPGAGQTVKFISWSDVLSDIQKDTVILFSRHSGRFLISLLLLGAIIAFVYWARNIFKSLDIREKNVFLSLYINEVFRKPLEVALLIGIFCIRLLVPGLPVFYSSLAAIISVYAVIRIAIDILPYGFRKFLIGFAIAYLLLRFYNLVYDQHLLGRLTMLVAQVITLIYLVVFILSRWLILAKKRSAFNYALSLLSIVFLVLLGVALIGNIAGAVTFSEYFSTGIINSGFFVIITYVGFHIAAALLYLFIASPLLKHSNIIRQQSDYIYSRIYNLIRAFFVLCWFYLALDQFHIREILTGSVSSFLSRNFEIGEAEFALNGIILFVLVIWLSIVISKFVRHILQEEIFTRVTVERGIPGTIIMLVRIALITIGFLLAAAVAGMKLSSLTIIIGAFSVGIGFGLQNIFNNLVSGLILAFERPIKEGDTVEVNALLGVVKRIGIRSSVVRTFDGAEVIVPNGTLISNELINWTLSDAHRRADIRVGVAYGTNPDSVLEILLKVARENTKVIQEPAPRALFLGFGDSSLDFRLLAWAELENRLDMESEIKVAINRELKEAGIEIPFPQHDLHIRSVDPKAGKNLK